MPDFRRTDGWVSVAGLARLGVGLGTGLGIGLGSFSASGSGTARARQSGRRRRPAWGALAKKSPISGSESSYRN